MNPEFHEQCAVADYIDMRYPELLWTASCGGMRTSMGVAVKMKQSGYKKGCPDILIFEPKANWHGLLIELKADKTGYPSDSQKEFLQKANERGYKAMVCNGFVEARKVIDDYFSLQKM